MSVASLALPSAGSDATWRRPGALRRPYRAAAPVGSRRYTPRELRFAVPMMPEMESPRGPDPIELAPEERDLLERLRAGDEAAFLALVKRHHRGMLRVASMHVRSYAIAEEVVQEAWLGVLKGLHLFEGRSSLKAWIFRIVVNGAKARGARESRTTPMSALEEPGDEGPAVSPDRFLDEGERWPGHWSAPPEPWPDARVESGEVVALVRVAMEALPEAQRTVMSLRDVDGWDSGEVCELLGISEGNQRVLLHRARSKVRALVEARMAEGRA